MHKRNKRGQKVKGRFIENSTAAQLGTLVVVVRGAVRAAVGPPRGRVS